MQSTRPRSAPGTRYPNHFDPRYSQQPRNSASVFAVVTDRAVRFTEDFFARLELLLPEDRGGDGTPSITDFLVFDVPPIRDKLARNFEAETLPTEDPLVRVHIGAGILVNHIAVFATLGNDGAVEAFWSTIDRSRTTTE